MVMGFSVGVAVGLLDNTKGDETRQPTLRSPALLLKRNGRGLRFARQAGGTKIFARPRLVIRSPAGNADPSRTCVNNP
jgi:hypothetical protein